MSDSRTTKGKEHEAPVVTQAIPEAPSFAIPLTAHPIAKIMDLNAMRQFYFDKATDDDSTLLTGENLKKSVLPDVQKWFDTIQEKNQKEIVECEAALKKLGTEETASNANARLKLTERLKGLRDIEDIKRPDRDHTGNNIIIPFQSNSGNEDHRAVLSIGVRTAPNLEAVKRLSVTGMPKYFPKTYVNHNLKVSEESPYFHKTWQSALQIQNQRGNHFPNREYGFINVGEYLETLGDTAKEVQKKNNPQEAINFAIHVANKKSEQLSNFSANGIASLDEKPSNTLIRLNSNKNALLSSEMNDRDKYSNIEIVTTDVKAIRPYEQLNTIPSKDGKLKIDFADTTAAYKSKATYDKAGVAIDSRKAIIDLQEKEYSYELAQIFYKALTGEEKKPNDPFKKDGYPKFDVESHPVFKTPQGKYLGEIITRLTHDDPAQRMHHTDAAKLLNTLNPVYKDEHGVYQKADADSIEKRYNAALETVKSNTMEKMIAYYSNNYDRRQQEMELSIKKTAQEQAAQAARMTEKAPDLKSTQAGLLKQLMSKAGITTSELRRTKTDENITATELPILVVQPTQERKSSQKKITPEFRRSGTATLKQTAQLKPSADSQPSITKEDTAPSKESEPKPSLGRK